ncbi:tRNA (adenosine(37)-N6)-threonylcarbamoyltransferase complex dimerization subunit type 1 TsaB [Flammeovirgaceae bacterium SG7u.111]|nr:tRNA (adenosine(37)-N6)-threonylcarbamoyltransferase complex dimerization subunit type 1 TsaB [Flammeovirgaceae bacterium SG7u.132]WPO35739.1 tRNA (adenosine(37)-N6)-threonylcarbamoyltransferase complex dimerization subunit type 1 TsaB [Flammeovirgaceae bacterium SG7u.111]
MILSIETSTPVCSVALHEKGELVSYMELRVGQSHSGQLTMMVDNILERAAVSYEKIEAVAVSEGPGSYTGLRIGVSTAKGICYANELPLLNVGTLDSMALAMGKNAGEEEVVCPMLDARRMEVYCAIYQNRKLLKGVEAKVIDEESFSDLYKHKKLLLGGPGSEKCKGVLISSNIAFIDGVGPSAKEIGELAWEKYQNQDFADLAYFEPFYLKAFLAKKPSKKPF